jgi:hypothetical protein
MFLNCYRILDFVRKLFALFIGLVSLLAFVISANFQTTVATFKAENLTEFANNTVTEMKKNALNELTTANKMDNQTVAGVSKDVLKIQEAVQNDSQDIANMNTDTANIIEDVTRNDSANMYIQTPPN